MDVILTTGVTYTQQTPFTLFPSFEVAVILHLPVLKAKISPASSTVAISSLEDSHVTSLIDYGVRAGGGYTTRTGTSVAAAHAAGAAALLLTWGVTDGNLPYMGTNEVKSVLIRGAKRENNTVYPNNIYGYGKMDVIEAFYKLRTG